MAISHDPGPNAVSGSTENPNAPAVGGVNNGNKAFGFLGGELPSGTTPVGAYGESPSVGVFGFADTAQGTGVAGNSARGAGTGVQGHTSTGVGVLGTSDSTGPAGRFKGNVEIQGGRLTIDGQDVLALITQLQQQVQSSSGGRTDFGQPVVSPVSRPQLIVRVVSEGFFDITGSGFQPRLQRLHIIRRVGATNTGDIFAQGDSIQLTLASGDAVTVMGTDERSDDNDITGLLWSNSRDLSRP
jgi:hypothetical protein